MNEGKAQNEDGLCPENLFEPLPRKAKRRKKMIIHDDKESGQVTSLVPRINPVTPMLGVGIQALDPQRLMGSQRIGIIGLPFMSHSSRREECEMQPGTGKSTCCMSLLHQLVYNFPIINVFSGSEADNPYYSLCIPKLFIQTNVTRKGLKQFINRQRLVLGHDTPLKNGLLILDDCFETPGALDNDMMRILTVNPFTT